MKGEKITKIITDMGTVIAVMTFFGSAVYLLFDLHAVLLDGWTGITLRVIGIAIVIYVGYVPYWIMSVFFRRMNYVFFGLGASFGFVVGDFAARISILVLGMFYKGGYIFYGGIICVFFVIFFVTIFCDKGIAWLVAHRVHLKENLTAIRQGVCAFVDRRIF